MYTYNYTINIPPHTIHTVKMMYGVGVPLCGCVELGRGGGLAGRANLGVGVGGDHHAH
jgi:hypothetical protein